MKKINILALVVLMVAMLSSCSKNEYKNVIPANATLVASFDFKSLAEEADLPNSEAMKMMNEYMGLVVSGNDKDKVKEYMDDPSEMGIDFTAPVYFFATPNDCMAFTMKVGSKGDLEDFLSLLAKQGLATKAVERNDLMCGTLLDDIDYTYNGSTLLLVSCLGDGGTAVSKQTSAQLMALTEEESFLSTDAYSKMDDVSGNDVVIYSNLGVLPSDVSEHVMMLLPKTVKKNDVELIATADFVNGAMNLSSNIWGKTEAAQKLIDEVNDNMKSLEGRYTGLPDEDFLLWASMGMKGKWWLDKMKDDKDMSQMIRIIERGIDIEEMLRAVEGDAAIVVPASVIENSSKSNDPLDIDFLFTAQLENKDFLKDVDYWQQSMKEYGISMRKTGACDYLINFDGKGMQWGVDEDNLYMGSADYMAKRNATPQKSSYLEDYASDIKSNQFYAYVNLKAVPLREVAMVFGMPQFGDKLAGLKSIIIKSASADKMEITVEMDDKSENFLKKLL